MIALGPSRAYCRRAAAARRCAAHHAADPQSQTARWPNATIDALVFEAPKEFSPAIRTSPASSTMPERPSAKASFALLRQLWRRYDLAISTQSGDRPTLFAWAAGRRSVGLCRACR
jgi:hypothetical protein